MFHFYYINTDTYIKKEICNVEYTFQYNSLFVCNNYCFFLEEFVIAKPHQLEIWINLISIMWILTDTLTVIRSKYNMYG